jgi:hypothetical protein
MKWKKEIYFVLVGFAELTGPAWAGEYRLKFVPHVNPKEMISGLKWDEDQNTIEPVLQMEQSKEDGSPQSASVRLGGSYSQSGGTLLLESVTPISIAADGKFTIEVTIDSKSREFMISEINSNGTIIKQQENLLFPEWEEFSEGLNKKLNLKNRRYSLSANLGFSYINYQESAISINLVELGLNTKLSGGYSIIPKKIEAEVISDFAFPAYALDSSLSTIFMEGEFRLNYQAPIHWLKCDYFVSIGDHFWKMFVAKNTYGINFLNGPRLRILSRSNQSIANTDHDFFAYLNFTLFLNETSSFNFSNFGIGGGGGYQITSIKSHPLALTFDLSQLRGVFSTGIDSFSLFSTSLGILIEL